MNVLLSLKAMRSQTENTGLRKYLIAFLALSLLTISGYAQAQTQIKLALCLDATTSIDSNEWKLETRGTASGLHEALYPDTLNGEVEVTVITFAVTANTVISPVLIDSLATLESLTGTLANNWEDGSIFALSQGLGGSTSLKSCIDEASSQIGGTADDGIVRVIDMSTDGAANRPINDCGSSIYESFSNAEECALMAADAAYNNGIDVLNILAVGLSDDDVSFLRVLTVPTPADVSTQGGLFQPPTTNPVLGDKGFVVDIADFNQYQPAITAKIRAEAIPRTVFTVNKSWVGGADPGEVDVQFTCTGALVDGDPNTKGKTTIANTASFSVTEFEPGMTCSAVETPFPGWTQTDNTCVNMDVETPSTCTITNTMNDVPPPTDTPPPKNPELVPTLPLWALLLLPMLLITIVYRRHSLLNIK